jgi:phosphoglucosamine mutase
MNQRKYFGTDGIRGLVGHWPISADFMLKLGRAVGSVLASEGRDRPKVLIGKDTRVSGYMFESALEAGACRCLPDPFDARQRRHCDQRVAQSAPR